MARYVKDGHELGALEGSLLATELEKAGWKQAGTASSQEPSLLDLKKPELEQLATDREIEVPANATKADIVELIERADAAN